MSGEKQSQVHPEVGRERGGSSLAEQTARSRVLKPLRGQHLHVGVTEGEPRDTAHPRISGPATQSNPFNLLTRRGAA